MPRQAHGWAGAFLPQPILCFSSRPSQWNPSEQFSGVKGPYHIDLLLNSFKGVGGSPPGCDRRRGWLASAVAAVNLLHLSEMDVRLGREEGARARGWGRRRPQGRRALRAADGGAGGSRLLRAESVRYDTTRRRDPRMSQARTDTPRWLLNLKCPPDLGLGVWG